MIVINCSIWYFALVVDAIIANVTALLSSLWIGVRLAIQLASRMPKCV